MDGLTRRSRRAACTGAMLAVSLLAACGGGDEDARKLTAGATAREKPAALTPGAASDVEAFFNWVEQQYPQHFPRGAVTQSIVFDTRHYTVRHYPATGNYVGLMDGGLVRALGPFTSGELTSFGSVEPYLCQIKPELCQKVSSAMARVVIDARGRQCEAISAEPLLEARRRLTDAGIAVARSDCGLALVGVPSVCGAPDTRYWMFDIPAEDVDKAVALGFSRPTETHPGKPAEMACTW